MSNPDQRPKVNIILASKPSFPAPPGLDDALESQDDFRIVARPKQERELSEVMDWQIRSVLIMVAGFCSFLAIPRAAARKNIPMVIILPHNAAPDSLEVIRRILKETVLVDMSSSIPRPCQT